MISLQEFKEALGDYAERLKEEEIEKLKQIEEQLADILIEHVRYENSILGVVFPTISLDKISFFAINNSTIIINTQNHGKFTRKYYGYVLSHFRHQPSRE